MGRPARFWNRIAERYSKQPIADEAAYQKKLQVTRDYLRPDMQVLEFGCGTGSTAILHAPHVRHILAIDFSQKMIDIARAKADVAGIKNIAFECRTIDELDQQDQSLDVVLGLSILHLLKNRQSVVTDVYRMLKPGGIFISSTPCLGDTMQFLKIIAPLGRLLGLMPVLRVFSIRELLDGLTSAGFDIDYQWQPGKDKAVFIVAKKPVQR